MSITQEQVSKISKKLGKLTPKNEEKLVKNISSILEYVDLLNEVDTAGVVPTVSVITGENHLKDDVEKRNISQKDLLACSPQKVVANQIAISDIMK